MKIVPEILQPESAQAVARTSAVYDAQWKKALEDAQWQARQRIAADTGENQRPPDDSALSLRAGAGNDSATTAMFLTAALGGVAVPQAAGTARADALGRALIDAMQPAAARLTQVNRSAAVASSPAAAPARTQPGVAGSDMPIESLERAQPQPLQFNGLPEWPAVVVHASVAGNQISLVIRDRNVTAAEATALHQRLRGQLRASGLELAQLTLNGQQVTGEGVAGPLAQVSQ